MRQTKMIEWMENVEKAIARIMADKVYTSAEFKRERDNFHVSVTTSMHDVDRSLPTLDTCAGSVQRLGARRGQEVAAANLGNLDGGEGKRGEGRAKLQTRRAHQKARRGN